MKFHFLKMINKYKFKKKNLKLYLKRKNKSILKVQIPSAYLTKIKVMMKAIASQPLKIFTSFAKQKKWRKQKRFHWTVQRLLSLSQVIAKIYLIQHYSQLLFNKAILIKNQNQI